MKAYASEIKYSHLEDLRSVVSTAAAAYEVDGAESAFERRVQGDLAAARAAHLNDELGIAIRGYQDLQALILKTANPTLPASTVGFPLWDLVYEVKAVPSFIAMAAESVSRTRPPVSTVPGGVTWPVPLDAKAVLADPAVLTAGARSHLDAVHDVLTTAAVAAAAGDYQAAVDSYTRALEVAGTKDPALAGQLRQDVGLLKERLGDAAGATTELEAAQKLFVKARSGEGQVSALAALSGLQTRQGDDAAAATTLERATTVSRELGIHPLEVAGTPATALAATRLSATDLALTGGIGLVGAGGRGRLLDGGVRLRVGGGGAPHAAGAVEPMTQVATPTLQALAYVADQRTTDVLSLMTAQSGVIEVDLTGDKSAALTALYDTMRVSKDISLLHIQAVPPSTFVAYLPYIYFFVLPMSLGDCYAASGDYASAETCYRNALKYPYLNTEVEVVQVWTRLAQTYVSWGDSLYRAAGDDPAAWKNARDLYTKVVKVDGGIPTSSPLYSGAVFAPMLARAQAIVAAADPTTVDDNAGVVLPITRARLRLSQIAAGQNFLGFAPDYLPPFSFESLQTSARYLTEHASSMEQAYIQFKSQAENEEFRTDQMDQQVDLASASVQLEQAGVAQAQAGVTVAARSQDYATTQLDNAQAAADAFADVRWELEELAQLEAWAQASAVDHDDQVKLTITNYEYFGADHENRNVVLQRLAAQRAGLTDDLEQARLDREVASAQAYQAVSKAQVAQAQAGVAVAQQRVAVAQLQQRQAEENREFLELREFSARHWYDMAQTMKGLSTDYLDMATSVAWLMQRAYLAETARDLHKIRLDYRNAGAGSVLGADVLLRDVDFFTVDYLTSTRSKKAPIKISFSISQTWPTALKQLRADGIAFLETTLDQLDRLYPGFYLHKVRDVEVQLVGISSGEGIHGTLRNVGVSSFRASDGTVQQLVYPPDVMPLSQYDARTDAIVLRADPQQLRLFENNGAATMWRLELPPGINDVDLAGILDAYLVLSFDAFFDGDLETTVKAGLPTTGSASRVTSMRLQAPDELFFLRTQGTGVLAVDAADLPRTQTDLTRTSFVLGLVGDPSVVANRAVTLTPASTGVALDLTTDADGVVSGAPVASLLGAAVADSFTVALAGDASGVVDVSLYQAYSFTWR